MSRSGVVAAISRRSQFQQPTLDIWMPPPTDTQLAADFTRVQARLAQRAAVKASADFMRVQARLAQRAAAKASADVMRVQARLAQRAAAKASAPNVAAKRLEVPRVPRVARQPWQHAPTLESKESSLKAIRHTVPARSDKSRAVQNAQPRNEPTGRCHTPRPIDFSVVASMAPRATRTRAVDVSTLAFTLPRTPKVAVKSILRGGVRQQKRGEKKKVSFGDVETKEVERWIGIVQGVESDNQLFDDEGRRCKGRFVHVFPDPNRR